MCFSRISLGYIIANYIKKILSAFRFIWHKKFNKYKIKHNKTASLITQEQTLSIITLFKLLLNSECINIKDFIMLAFLKSWIENLSINDQNLAKISGSSIFFVWCRRSYVLRIVKMLTWRVLAWSQPNTWLSDFAILQFTQIYKFYFLNKVK